MKINKYKFGHMTNMAAMPIYGKIIKKKTNKKQPSSPEPMDWLSWNLECSIGGLGAYRSLFKCWLAQG